MAQFFIVIYGLRKGYFRSFRSYMKWSSLILLFINGGGDLGKLLQKEMEVSILEGFKVR